MQSFDLEKAHSDEQYYLEELDFRKLVDINIKFFDNLGSISVYTNRLPRIGFYFGRTYALEEFKKFLDSRNQYLEVFFSMNDDILKLTLDCFKYGYSYSNLSEELKQEIREYFANPKYSELFSEIMYAYDFYVGEVEPYDFSKREIRQFSYSEQLISKLGDILISNNGTQYYDRGVNDVRIIDEYEDSIRGVHFLIDYTGITNKILYSVIKLLLEETNIKEPDFEQNILNEVLNGDSSMAGWTSFGNYDFQKIVTSFSKHNSFKDFNNSQISKRFLKTLAIDYLTFVNSIPI
jgi:hypothetical protein